MMPEKGLYLGIPCAIPQQYYTSYNSEMEVVHTTYNLQHMDPGKTICQNIQVIYKQYTYSRIVDMTLNQKLLFGNVFPLIKLLELKIFYLPQRMSILSQHPDYTNIVLNHLDEQILFDIFKCCQCLFFLCRCSYY